jgi:hypothetical protein
MKHHIIAQLVNAALIYGILAFAFMGWWSPLDWGGDWGGLFRAMLAVCWMWSGVLAALIAEDWRNA